MFCVDAIDFHESIRLGHIVNLTGRITFTSSRSMEVKVIVDAQDLLKGIHFLNIVLPNESNMGLFIIYDYWNKWGG